MPDKVIVPNAAPAVPIKPDTLTELERMSVPVLSAAVIALRVKFPPLIATTPLPEP